MKASDLIKDVGIYQARVILKGSEGGATHYSPGGVKDGVEVGAVITNDISHFPEWLDYVLIEELRTAVANYEE